MLLSPMNVTKEKYKAIDFTKKTQITTATR